MTVFQKRQFPHFHSYPLLAFPCDVKNLKNKNRSDRVFHNSRRKVWKENPAAVRDRSVFLISTSPTTITK